MRGKHVSSEPRADRRRVAVVGGGISGVATAYQLALEQARHPVECVLLEASGRLGGIVETRHSHGFVIECGPDSWVTEKPWARDLAIELGLGPQIIPSNDHQRRTYLLDGERLIPMPDGMRMMVPTDFEALERSPLFSAEALRAYREEPDRAAELKSFALSTDQDESVATFVRRHFGEEVASKIAGPLLAGVFGGSVENLSVRSVMPAFVKMEREHGSLVEALRRQVRADRGASSVFTTLTSGLGALVEGMVAKIPAGSIRLNHEVTAIKRSAENWVVEAAGRHETFDDLVLATPAHITRGLLEPLDATMADLLTMEATSAIVVALAFAPAHARQMRIPPGFGFLVPQVRGSASSLLACTFVDQKFSHRVPEGGVLLRGFFGGEQALGLLEESDADLLGRTLTELRRILGPIPEPDEWLVRRWPKSLPQYSVGHQARIEELERRLSGFPGLQLVGNAYHGVGLPDLIRDGRAAASRLVADASSAK